MSDQDSIQHLVQQLRLAGLDQFKIFVKSAEVDTENRALKELPYTQQLAHILVSGDGLELNIKTHFMINVVRLYTNDKLGISDASDRHCIDFMKELCNVVAGKAKAMLEDVGLVLGQSLPFAMQGYNELFYQSEEKDVVHDAWTIKGPHGAIDCSITLRIINPDVIKVFKDVAYQEQYGSGSGDIELF